ncbi:hypothetical protein [Bosea caraganae]|uniref:hypothetical protein n=1 Tax=Bosea caraganae TaxID=2763117 RepID=UPI0011C08366|nr:hypothetical protein [Bosea caraganae]
MLSRIFGFLNPLHNAETITKRYFFSPGMSQGLLVLLVRLKGDTKVVFMMPRASDESGGNLDGNPVILPSETLDGMIAFLQECRETAGRNRP